MRLERLIYQTGKQVSQQTEWLLGWLGSRGDCSKDLMRALETTRNTLGPIGAISWYPWKMTSQDPTNSPCWYRRLSSWFAKGLAGWCCRTGKTLGMRHKRDQGTGCQWLRGCRHKASRRKCNKWHESWVFYIQYNAVCSVLMSHFKSLLFP